MSSRTTDLYRARFVTPQGASVPSILCTRGNADNLGIDRRYPTNLMGDPASASFTEGDWHQFCNRIDEILLKLCASRRRNSKLSCWILSSFLLMLFLGPMMATKKNLLNNVYLKSDGALILTGLIVVTFYIGAGAYLISSAKNQGTKITKQMWKVCTEASRASQDRATRRNGSGEDFVSLYLRRQQVYSYGKPIGNLMYIEVRTGNSRRRSRTPDTHACESEDDERNDFINENDCDEENQVNAEEDQPHVIGPLENRVNIRL